MASSELIADCCTKAEEAETHVTEIITGIRQSLGSICGIDDFEQDEHDSDQKLKQLKTLSVGSIKLMANDDISQRERGQWLARFEQLDKNNSGKVGFMELKELLEHERKKTIPREEMAQIMRDYDFDQDGQLNFEEFLVLRAFTTSKKRQMFKAKAHETITGSQSVTDLRFRERKQAVHITGIPRAEVKKYLRKELDENSACLQLPWALAIFLFFGLSVSMHFRFDVMYALDEAITFDVEENANFAFSGIVPYENGRMGHKTMYDVNTIADFWSWMTMGLVPVFWPQSWDVNEVRTNVQAKCTDAKSALQGFGWPSPNLNFTPGAAALAPCPEDLDGVQWSQSAERFFGQRKLDGHYLVHSSIIGGVRMRQERVPAEACSVANEDGKTHAGLCLPDRRGLWLEPELSGLLKFDTNYESPPGAETVYLLSRKQQSDLKIELRSLEDRMWFSPETAKIEILFTIYHARYNVLTATHIYFVLNEAGHIHKRIDPFSFFLSPYNSEWLYVIDIGWLLLIFKLFVEEGWEIAKHIKQLGCCKGLWEYIDIPNLVDWLSIIYAWVVVILWAVHVKDLSEITDLMKQGNPELVGTWADASLREQFYVKVHDATQFAWYLRVVLSIYPFVIVSRFFKAFSAQARLALVTRTLTQAAVDIFHFGIVFGCVFLVYTLSALILWGGENEYFSNFARAFNSVFRLMLGDFDWEEMHDVGRAQALLWFWTFTWLVNLIMLNMLLAIIMDVYTDVKAGVGNAPTLWQQAAEMYHREKLVRQGHALRLSTVLDLLDPTALDEDDNPEEDEELIIVETLINDYGLRIDQAEEILMEAQANWGKEAKKENKVQMSEHRMMSRVETKVVQMHRFLEAFVRCRTFEHNNRGPSQPPSTFGRPPEPREVEL